MRTAFASTFLSYGHDYLIALLVGAVGLAGTSRVDAQCPPAWVPGIGTVGVNGDVNAVAVLPGGDVIVGGRFTTAGGVPAANIARYNPTTGVWSPLGAGAGFGAVVYALAVVSNGDVIVGGQFDMTFLNDASVSHNIARYNPTADYWTPLGQGLSGQVRSLSLLSNGDVMVGGYFSGLWGGVQSSNLLKLHPNRVTSAMWEAFPGPNGPVHAAVELPPTAQSTGDTIVGGIFTAVPPCTACPTPGGIATYNIARRRSNSTYDWSAMGTQNDEYDGGIYALAVLPGGDLIVGGEFPFIAGVAVNNISRYNPATGVWSAIGAGTSGSISSLKVLLGGDVIVGGSFGSAGGVASSGIARYNPTTGDWSALGSGLNGPARAMAFLPSGDLIVGGSFTSAGGVAASNIARYSFGAAAPGITAQPLPVVTAPSGSAMFYTAAVAGYSGPLTYQWRKDGVALSAAANPSAATQLLSLTNLQSSDLGSYDCLVTNSCGAGTASNAVTLTFAGGACVADLGVQGGIPGHDGVLDNNDFIVYIDAFFSHTGCP